MEWYVIIVEQRMLIRYTITRPLIFIISTKRSRLKFTINLQGGKRLGIGMGLKGQ